jgi:glycosyltransferase involved in cell wall biosynthesis
MSGDLVSVVIPTYNRAGRIERAIDSVLSQTYQTLDIIVVDDGSTDDTEQRIATRYGRDRRVRYLHQPNRGVSAARNLGIAAVRGEFMALLDSDDLWKPWKLEAQLCALHSIPEVGMIWTDLEAIGPGGELVSSSYLRTMYRASFRWFTEDSLFPNARGFADLCHGIASVPPDAKVFWGDIFSQMIMGNFVHTSTVLMRRDRLNRVGGFNESLKISGEDYDFHLRTCREGPVAFLNVPSIQYQIGRTDQLSHRKYEIHMARNFLETITPILKHDRDRISLPPHMIAAVQAFAHEWIGMEYTELGNQAMARAQFRNALHFSGLKPKIGLLYALSFLPSSVCRRILDGFRAVKRMARSRVT